MSKTTTHSKQYWAPCGKNRYADKKSAQSEINLLSRRHLKSNRRHGRVRRYRCYHCEDCEGWHISAKK